MTTGRRTLLIVTELFAPGGVQQVGREAMAALSESGERLEVWTLRDRSLPAGAARPGVHVRCAGGDRWRLIAWAMSSAIGRGFDTVVVMHAHLAPVALPLAARGAFVSVMLHGIEVWKPLSSMERRALRRADRLIANSAYTATRFRQANPEFAGVDVEVCPLGVAPLASSSGEAVETDACAALVVGRLATEERYKGHDALLDAWSAVRSHVAGARLVVIGDGDDRTRLEARAAALGLADAVQFLGRLPDAEVERWYQRCAFFVLPSLGEGFGLVYLEAMRAGKACIACAGAAAEIVEPERTGVIVADQEPAALAEAIVRLFSDPGLCARLGDNGRTRWRERFTAAHFAARFRQATVTREHAA